MSVGGASSSAEVSNNEKLVKMDPVPVNITTKPGPAIPTFQCYIYIYPIGDQWLEPISGCLMMYVCIMPEGFPRILQIVQIFPLKKRRYE